MQDSGRRRFLSRGVARTGARLGAFALRVGKSFLRNKGFLLASAVGYNALLSALPLCAVVLVVLSHFIDNELILRIVSRELRVLIPGQEAAVSEAMAALLEERELVGGIGFLVLLFFSSIAFRMLEEAMAVIFQRQAPHQARHPAISALIPFVYITSIGIALLGLTLLTALLQAAPEHGFLLWRWEVRIEDWTAGVLELAGLAGSAAMLSSFYVVMPVAKVRLRLALIGGMVAAILWEIVRRLLVWYLTTVSLVNVIYGSLAAGVIILLSMEAAALIVLVGAQVIAELEQSANAGLKWYQAPPALPD